MGNALVLTADEGRVSCDKLRGTAKRSRSAEIRMGKPSQVKTWEP